MEQHAAFNSMLNYPALIKSARIAPNWLPDGRLWFSEGAPDQTKINAIDPSSAQVAPLFDIPTVRAAYQRALGIEAPYEGLPFDRIVPMPQGYMVQINGKSFMLDASGETLTAVPEPSFTDNYTGTSPTLRTTPETYTRPGHFPDTPPVPEMMSPDGRWFSSIREHNLWLRSTVTGCREQITSDGNLLNSWDVESTRMAIGPGATPVFHTVSPWAPDGLKLLATKFDRTGVTPVTRTRYASRRDEVEELYFSRAGDRLSTTQPFVVHILDRRAVRIDVPVADRIYLPLGWREDGEAVYFAQFSRDMTWAGVYEADASNGDARLLVEEKGDSFIRIQHEVVLGRPGVTLLSGGRGFIWESERSGWTHFYHYAADGSFIRQLTSGDWAAVDIIAVDEGDEGFVYFSAHHDSARPYDVHICRVPLAGGKVERLSEGPGVHDAQFSPSKQFFIDTVSQPSSGPRSTLRRTTGEAIYQFDGTDLSPLEALGWLPPEEFSVKAADGETDLWGIVLKPRGFDPSKSYPVIEHIYGGPQIAWTPHHFPNFPIKQSTINWALPMLGYVVVILDSRGTPERSKAFHDVTYKEWRRHLTADHAAALRNLAADRPWMDLNRVGMWGHSWGGYSTIANLLDNPDLYKAGIASAPGIDPYDSFIYEPYLGGAPAAHNKTAYDDALLYTDATKLQGELMIVAGTNDVFVWHNAIKMSNALIEAGRQHDFVALPGQHHGYSTPHESYFIARLVEFFARHLSNPAPRSSLASPRSQEEYR